MLELIATLIACIIGLSLTLLQAGAILAELFLFCFISWLIINGGKL